MHVLCMRVDDEQYNLSYTEVWFQIDKEEER